MKPTPQDLARAMATAAKLQAAHGMAAPIDPIAVLLLAAREGLRAREACICCASGLPCQIHPAPERPRKGKLPHERAQARYAAAYAEGQLAAGASSFAPPTDNRATASIRAMVTTHARDITGEALIAWIRATSEAYRRATSDKPQFEGGYAPHACLRWLDAGRPGNRATGQHDPTPGRRSRREVEA